MLGRYVGGTVLILGAAMLLAPEPDRPTGPVAETAAEGRAGASVAATRAAAPEFAPDRARIDPVAAAPGTAATPRKPAPAPTPAPAPSLAAPQEMSLEDLVTQARAGGDVPSLRDPEGLAGTVSQGTLALIAAADASAPAPGRGAEAATAERLYVTGSRVNLRAGPSTRDAVVGSVAYGEAVDVLGYADDAWAEVRVEGRAAFMSRRFLAPTP